MARDTRPTHIIDPSAVIPGRQVDPQVGAMYSVPGHRTYRALRDLEANKTDLGVVTIDTPTARQALTFDGKGFVNGGSLTMAGFQSGFKVVSAAYTVTTDDHFVAVDASLGPVTTSLPLAAGLAGVEFTIKKIDPSVNAVTVSASGADLIDGVPLTSLASQYDWTNFTSDGTTNWFIS